MTFIYFSPFPCYSLFVIKKGAVIHMKINNNFINDKEINKIDTPSALISSDDLLKFFNLERDNVQKISITHKKDGVYVSITLNQTWCQCPVCGNMTNRVKDYKDKKITHSILTVTSCYIIYHARRYQCIHCKKAFYENNPFTFGGRLSVVTVSNVLKDLKSPNATFTDVAKRYDISITTAINLFDRHVHISRRQLPECLALDEVYAFKSHDSDYICVIVDYLDKKIIDVLPSRHKNVLINYFMLIPREEREKVKYVSFDMWNTYRIVTKHVFPNAVCITDHFHVIQDLNRRVDKVRVRIQNRYKKRKETLKQKEKDKTITKEEILELEEASRYYYVLKKFNWLLFSTNNRIFDDNNEKKLNHVLNRYCNYSDLFTYMLSIDEELETASNLKDQVVYFYDHCNYDNAKKKLEEIIIDFRSCPVEEMAPFANTLINWKNEIINSFIIVDERSKRKMNTAIVENRNKTIKLIKHASNGYLNWERFRNRILYTLNDDTTYYFTCIRKDRN